MNEQRLRFVLGLIAAAALLGLGALCYPLRASIPLVVRGVLPDFFWAMGLSCALAAFRSDRRWIALGFLVAELLELAQLHPAVPGTFDVLDLLALAVGYGAGLLVAAMPLGVRGRLRPQVF